MAKNFKQCLEHVLVSEGGFSDHPKDPGGVTNKGITARVYEEFLGEEVTKQMMQDIPDEHVEEIYRDQYWDVVCGDELPAGVDLCVFDFGVNAGPVRSVKMLQSSVGAVSDGILGPNTLNAVDEHDPQTVIEVFCGKREDYYRSLRHFKTFGKGWLRRNDDVRDTALDMV